MVICTNYINSTINNTVLKKILKENIKNLYEIKKSKFIFSFKNIINIYEVFIFYIPCRLISEGKNGVLKVFMNKNYEIDFTFIYLKNDKIEYLNNFKEIFTVGEISDNIRELIEKDDTFFLFGRDKININDKIKLKEVGKSYLREIEVKSGIKDEFTIFTKSSIYYENFGVVYGMNLINIFKISRIKNLKFYDFLDLICGMHKDMEEFNRIIVNNINNYDFLYKFIEKYKTYIFDNVDIKNVLLNREKKIVVEEENGESYETTMGALALKYNSKLYLISLDTGIAGYIEGMDSFIPCASIFSSEPEKLLETFRVFMDHNFSDNNHIIFSSIERFNLEEYYDLDDENIDKEEALDLFLGLSDFNYSLNLKDCGRDVLMDKKKISMEKKNIFAIENLFYPLSSIDYYFEYGEKEVHEDINIKEIKLKKIIVKSLDKEVNSFNFVLYVYLYETIRFIDNYPEFTWEDPEPKSKDKKDLLKYMNRIFNKKRCQEKKGE